MFAEINSHRVEIAFRGVGEAVEQAVHAFEHRRGPEKPAVRATPRATLTAPPSRVHAFGPCAFRQIFDDARCHRADDAERIDHCLPSSFSAVATAAAAPMAPKIAVG